MPDLHLLGPLELTGTTDSARALLAQPKRVGLLAYIALAGRRGPIRRDLLLPLFWPEADDARARNNLRSALHFLREALGRKAVVSRGSQEVGLDPALVRCDAAAFEDACDAGRNEEALRLYRGHLLPGFFLDGADGFARWLDEERGLLRRRASSAAWALADAAESKGHAGLAAHNARRAYELDDESERAICRLIDILARTGDRVGAIAAFDAYKERLRLDYDLQPEAELVVRIEKLRRAPGIPVAAAAPTAASPIAPASEDGAPLAGDASARTSGVGSAAVEPADMELANVKPAGSEPPVLETIADFQENPAPHTPPPSLPSADSRARRRTTKLAIVPLTALALTLVAVRVIPSPGPATPAEVTTPERGRLAVLPFDYHGTPDLAYLHYGIVPLLSSRLDGAGALRTLDTRASLGGRSGVPASFVDSPKAAAALARELGAAEWVSGSIVEEGDSVQLTAALYSVDSDATPELYATAEGPRGAVVSLVDQLALRIMETRDPHGMGSRAVRTTHSLAAARAFLHGESAYRKGRWDEAMTAFKKATSFDSTFALAYYRLSTAAYAAGRRSIPAESRALHFAPRLPPLDSALVAAWGYVLHGRIESAHIWYRGLLDRRPADVEALFQSGDLVYHWSGLLGLPPSNARHAFEQVLDYEPDDVQAVVHLGRIAARQGDTVVVDSMVRRLRALGADPAQTLELELIRAWLLDDTVAADATVKGLLAAPAATGRGALMVAIASTEKLDWAALLEKELAAREPLDPDVVLRAVEIAAGRGRFAEASDALASPALVPERTIEFRAMLAGLPYAPFSRGARDTIRRSLAAVHEAPVPPETDSIWRGSAEIPPLAWRGIFEPRRQYLLGMLALELGDSAAFDAAVTKLERAHPGDSTSAERSLAYARILRARQALEAGDADRGLVLLGPQRPPSPMQFETALDYPRAYERLLRAQLLEALGRDDDALRWYGTFPDPTAHDLPLLVPVHLARSRIFERSGDSTAALRERRAARTLWRDADPALRAELEHGDSLPHSK